MVPLMQVRSLYSQVGILGTVYLIQMTAVGR